MAWIIDDKGELIQVSYLYTSPPEIVSLRKWIAEVEARSAQKPTEAASKEERS